MKFRNVLSFISFMGLVVLGYAMFSEDPGKVSAYMGLGWLLLLAAAGLEILFFGIRSRR